MKYGVTRTHKETMRKNNVSSYRTHQVMPCRSPAVCLHQPTSQSVTS